MSPEFREQGSDGLDDELNAHSFVVRVWIEERPPGDPDGKWRGHVTHVLDRRRRSIDSFSDIQRFIEEYLDALSIERRRRDKKGST